MPGQHIHEVFPAHSGPDDHAGRLVDLLLQHNPHAGTLRRLGLRDAMAAGMRSRLGRSAGSIGGRSGYNPDEPRDDHGRWTSSGPSPDGRWTGTYGLYSGRLIRIEGGEDDEDPWTGTNQPPVPEDKARPGFEPSGHDVGGLFYPDHPLLDGKPWPTVSHDAIRAALEPQGRAIPTMQIYVPANGYGPLLVGSNSTTDFPPPPAGYDIVTLRGTPQYTYSRGQETNHAADSIEAAIAMAMTNRYSEIYFNRSFSTLSGGAVQSALRSDVVGVVRPEIEQMERYFPHEVLSSGQKRGYREGKIPAHPNIGKIEYAPYRAKI